MQKAQAFPIGKKREKGGMVSGILLLLMFFRLFTAKQRPDDFRRRSLIVTIQSMSHLLEPCGISQQGHRGIRQHFWRFCCYGDAALDKKSRLCASHPATVLIRTIGVPQAAASEVLNPPGLVRKRSALCIKSGTL